MRIRVAESANDINLVREVFRGTGRGQELTLAAPQRAARTGYHTIRLDTLPSMAVAHRLYESLGFYDIPPCWSVSFKGKRNRELCLDVQKNLHGSASSH